MNKHYTATTIDKVLIPVTPNCNHRVLLTAARLIVCQGDILLAGLVSVAPGESLSTGALYVRQVRQVLTEYAEDDRVHVLEQVQVSHDPWENILDILDEEQPDLLLLDWPIHFSDLYTSPEETLIRPACDIALVRGPIPEKPKKTLVSLRGSPYAEDALRLSLSVSRAGQVEITSLHLTPTENATWSPSPLRGLNQVLNNLPEVKQVTLQAEDPAETILEQSSHYDLVVMGVTARPTNQTSPVGWLTERVLHNSPVGVIAVKSTRSPGIDGEAFGHEAISILVDKWFAENTYHADEFGDLDYLLNLKKEQNLTVSLALPALNEQETVGNVIQTVKGALMDAKPLLDEIVLMDSDSTDQTRDIAESLGIPVYIHQHTLPEYGARLGKGEALWKSLYVTQGDILVWVDTDIVNIHPRFVYGLLGPLLVNPSIQFVKGFYRRPLRVGEKMQAGGGGRVTELTARPLLNLFYPELSGVVQPLSGEYGGRRSALEQLTFYSGYGVETGLLIDVFEKFGLSAIAQVDLRERIHHNQPLESLSKMSFAIIQVVIRKLEQRYGMGILEDVNRSMKLIRYEPGRLFLDVEKIAERDRPPMVDLPEYLEVHPR
jgi:glucosyl-3-phosphoglycerate synthase